MRAWANSIYFAGKAGGDRLSLLMDNVLADAQHDQQQEKARIAMEQQRKAYIKDKVRGWMNRVIALNISD